MRLGREGDKETQTEKNREREIESDSERDRERERQTDRQRGSNHLQSADVTEHCNRRLLSLICRRIGAFRFPCLLLNITERQVTLHEDSNSPSLTQSTQGLSLEDPSSSGVASRHTRACHGKCPSRNTSALAVKSGNNKILYMCGVLSK